MGRLITKYFILIIIICFIGQGCYYDAENYLYPNTNGCVGIKGSYATEVQPLMTLQCKGCHSGAAAGGGVNLETYDQVKLYSTKILSTINHTPGSSFMPKGEPQLSPCDIKKVQTWVDIGMPNN